VEQTKATLEELEHQRAEVEKRIKEAAKDQKQKDLKRVTVWTMPTNCR
jgi:predicted transcriptional regulator